MKKALDWIKENPISAASAVVGLIGVVVVIYFLFLAAGSLRDQVVEENEKPANDMAVLSRGSVSLPDPDPNNPPIEYGPFAITQDVINRVEEIYGVIVLQQSSIKGDTERRNQINHIGTIFVPRDDQASKRVNATDTYRSSFRHIFTPAAEPTGMPSFRAGPPPSGEVVNLALEQTVRDYIESVGAATANELTEAQAKDLFALQQVTLLTLLAERAEGLDFYADLPVEVPDAVPGAAPTPAAPVGGGSLFEARASAGGGAQFTGSGTAEVYGPFEIAAWSATETVPSLEQLWDGQVEIWIIRDLLTAIHLTNRVGELVEVTDPSDPDAEPRQIPTNVMTAPVKRLLSVQIIPGYVGLHTQGAGIAGAQPVALTPAAVISGSDDEFNEFDDTGDMPSGPAFAPGQTSGQSGDQTVDPLYPMPALATLPLPAEKLEGNFFFGTSGRRSNSIYDVRHARVVLHIEWDKLPMFYENLRATNFMSILDMQIRDVDEYAVLRHGGYVYGEGDVVEVEMVIETLWFRTWTTPFMPPTVRKRLAVQEIVDVIAE